MIEAFLTWTHKDHVVGGKVQFGELLKLIEWLAVVLKHEVCEEARVDVFA